MKKSVFITGAGKGLGLALGEVFLEAGYMVLAGIHNSTARRKLKGSFHAIPLDVTDEYSVSSAVFEASCRTNGLDILINNAGIHLENSRRPLEEADETDFVGMRQTFEVNALGPLRVVKAFLPLLEKGEKKLIINISSEAGSITDCWRDREFGYCMSKAALNMQSKILHNYLKPRGFKILVVHPGWMRTEMGGPEAHISPREAAEGILRLVNANLDDSVMYLDYQGTPLRW